MDRQVEKTNKAIIDSLMATLAEKPLNQITVKEIAQKANVGRKTFYLHFDSLDEVVQKIELDLQDDLIKHLSQEQQLTPKKLIKILNKLMMDNKSFYKNMLNSSYNLFIKDDMQLILKRALKQYYLTFKDLSEKIADYYSGFLAAGIVQCYNQYLQGPQQDIESMNSVLLQIFELLDK